MTTINIQAKLQSVGYLNSDRRFVAAGDPSAEYAAVTFAADNDDLADHSEWAYATPTLALSFNATVELANELRPGVVYVLTLVSEE